VYFTDRGIEELEKRRGEEEVTFEWLAARMREFVDTYPDFEIPTERLATWLARLDDDEDDLEEMKIRLERHDNCYYAYALDGGFLAQGRSFNELFDSFQARYPLQSFKIQKNTDLSDAERSQMISALEEMVKRITAK